MEILDPTAEATQVRTAPAPRLQSLQGKTVCLLDISKPKGSFFLDELERLLAEHGVARVVRQRKPTYSRPAPAALVSAICEEADCVIEALAD